MSYLIFNSDFLTALRIIHMINNIHFVVLLTLLLYRGKVHTHTHTHTHPFNGPFPGLPR